MMKSIKSFIGMLCEGCVLPFHGRAADGMGG